MERWLFAGLTLFWVLEYIRPPALAILHLQMPLTILLSTLSFRAFGRDGWSRLLTAQVIFLGLNAVHIPIASNNYSAYFITRILFGHVAIAITMALLLRKQSTFRRAISIWVGIMSYAAVHGLMHEGTGPGAMLGDENELALGCVTALPLAFFSLRCHTGRMRIFFLVACGLLVAGIVVSLSRGGFVALAVVLVACILMSPNRLRTIALIAVGGVVTLVLAPAEYVDEIKSIQREVSGETKHGTAETRVFLWTAAIGMFKSNPLLGVGGGNYMFQVGKFQPDWDASMYSERDWSGQAVHSLYFELLSEQGILGCFVWIVMVSAHLRSLRVLQRRINSEMRLPQRVRREINLLASGLMIATLGYMVAGAFLSVAYYPYAWYLVGFSVALRASAKRASRQFRAARQRRLIPAVASPLEAQSPA